MRPIVALSLLALMASPVMAADIAPWAPAAPQPAAAAPPAFTWTGFYIGANGGYGSTFGTADRLIGGTTVSASAPLSGFVGGGQIGYNWQQGDSKVVFGVEADLQGADMRHDFTATDGVTTVDGTDKISWFATVRARVGYAVVDNVLLYAAAGWAFVTFDSKGTVTNGGGSNTISWSQDRNGWTGGGGMEIGLGEHWSGKLEYLYMDVGTFSGVDALGAVPMRVQLHDHVFRIGLNYRFH
jgi:outer membrane immunogenic protein